MVGDESIKFEAESSMLTYTGGEVKTTVQYLSKLERAAPFKRDA